MTKVSVLNSIYFHCVIEKYDKVNDKIIEPKELKIMLSQMPSVVEWSFVLHNKDHTREHYHVNIMLKTSHQAETILHSIAKDLMCNVNCIGVISLNSCAFFEKQRYLMHLDNSDKYQYDLKEIVTSDLDHYTKCIQGLNPYTIDIQYIAHLCKMSDTLVEVYATLGISVSNTYRNLIKDIWGYMYAAK